MNLLAKFIEIVGLQIRRRGVTGLSKNFVGVFLYLTAATFVFAGMNAQDQWECRHEWSSICDEDMVARHRAMAATWALIPPAWIVSFLYTGGFHRGFSFDATPQVISGVDKSCKTEAEMANYIGDNVYQSSVDFGAIRFKGKTFVIQNNRDCWIEQSGGK